jgi:hypothetical protein
LGVNVSTREEVDDAFAAAVSASPVNKVPSHHSPRSRMSPISLRDPGSGRAGTTILVTRSHPRRIRE